MDENLFSDTHYETSQTNSPPQLGFVIPGWLVNFMSKTASFTHGLLDLEMRDKYGRVIIIPRPGVSITEYDSRKETKAFLQTTVSATPFYDYQLVAECLVNK